jgi:hypothetical protein
MNYQTEIEQAFNLTNREVSVSLVGGSYNIMVGGDWLMTLRTGLEAERVAVAICLDSGLNSYTFLHSMHDVGEAGARLFR